MSNKLLVSIAVIKNNSSIEDNNEPAKLRTAALEAQRVEVRSILGSVLTDYFVNAISDDGTLTGLTATQQTFYDTYLIPMYSAYVQAQYLYTVHYQVSSIGVVTNASSQKQAASDEAVKMLYKRAMNSADFHAQRAKNFILLPENDTDLGQMYRQSCQNLAPQTKVQQGFIYTPYRGT